MSKNANNFTIYVRDENIETWKIISDKGLRSEFLNWALKNKYNEYKEKTEKEKTS